MDLEFYVLGLGLDGPLLLLDYQGCTKEDDQQAPRKDAVFWEGFVGEDAKRLVLWGF